MAAALAPADVLRRKDAVVAAVDLPGVPEGTPGRVAMVSGLDWIRYWVRFDNGVERGSLDRRLLARADEWDAIKERRSRAGDEDGDGLPDAAGPGAGDGPAAAGGEGYVYNGVLVPQLLLDRSKKRREVLGA